MKEVKFFGGPLDGQSQYVADGVDMVEASEPNGSTHCHVQRYRVHLTITPGPWGRSESWIAVPEEWDAARAHAELLARYGRKPGQRGKMSV